jgi:hypothetical protein
VRLSFSDGHDFRQRRAFSAFHQRDDVGFLLARSVLGLLAGFPARPAFFVGVAFLAGARFVFGCSTSGADAFSNSVAGFISFLLAGLRSSHG